MTRVTRRLTAKNRDQLRNPTLGNRVWAIFTFLEEVTHALKDVRAQGGDAVVGRTVDVPSPSSPSLLLLLLMAAAAAAAVVLAGVIEV